jgi:hypothetical protein
MLSTAPRRIPGVASKSPAIWLFLVGIHVATSCRRDQAGFLVADQEGVHAFS